MIKLFDFKFLILLGLTLVVYFMYKEIDMQRDRLQQCENKINFLLETNPKTFHDKECELALPLPPSPNQKIDSRPKLTHPKYNQSGKQINNTPMAQNNENNKDSKQLKISLPVKINPDAVKITVTKKEEQNLNTNTQTEIDSSSSSSSSQIKETETCSDELLETDNKHLEIYSNDNENSVETTISDTLIKAKETEITKLDISASHTENTSTEKSNYTKDSEDSEIKKTEESKKCDESENSDSSNKELEEVLNNLKIELNESPLEAKSEEKKNKIDFNSILKLKLSEIQDLAKKENITLEKNINGTLKKKTKQELAEEIINLQKNI